MKTQTILLKLLSVLAFAGALSIWAPNPAQAGTTGMFGLARNSPAGMDVVQNRQRVGPFATWTRANEVANYLQQMGYSTTQPFHSGDGYYFDVGIGDATG
jgi:hypothetical protein